ncbi:hypothetical protein M6B38_357520 [Iris pallida]|uniref:Uncharacterized protein n=1 Tax=Iris pallida TaxID=29817 RepID=A0AAX6GMG4_IRIPA|nr:hypothetical protein M6B38_357520 [Iris pallida]
MTGSGRRGCLEPLYLKPLPPPLPTTIRSAFRREPLKPSPLGLHYREASNPSEPRRAKAVLAVPRLSVADQGNLEIHSYPRGPVELGVDY